MTLTLGVDPSSTVSYGALYDGTRIVEAGKLGTDIIVQQYVKPGNNECRYMDGKTQTRAINMLRAAVIETVDPRGGVYKAANGRVVISRSSNVLLTDRAGWRIAEQLRQAGVRVFTPSRRVILSLAGWATSYGSADMFVRHHLELLGMLTTRVDKRGTAKVDQPPSLRNVNARDAAMAALFNWQSPVNAQYEYLGVQQ